MKRQLFIGDVQGCADALARLLDRLQFDPARDRLRMVGDLVSRGGQSLAVLRLLYRQRSAVRVVLGNHDLHLLAYAHHYPRVRKANAEFEQIIEAADGPELLDWLGRQALFWKSEKRRLAMVHAGVDPRWSPAETRARAREVEQALRQDPERFFAHMYGDRPRRWKPGQPYYARMRCITNALTRMRFCDAGGRLDLTTKGNLQSAPRGFRPWFDFLHADWQGWTLVFGHWSMLGLFRNDRVVCLDSGCVWGGALTALVVDDQGEDLISMACRPNHSTR